MLISGTKLVGGRPEGILSVQMVPRISTRAEDNPRLYRAVGGITSLFLSGFSWIGLFGEELLAVL